MPDQKIFQVMLGGVVGDDKIIKHFNRRTKKTKNKSVDGSLGGKVAYIRHLIQKDMDQFNK